MSAPRLSVIMPVYNAARYLPAAAGSVLGQSFRNFELLLVDDASTDGSGALCDQTAANDPRVRALHRAENGGLSAAQNTGIAAAAGEYLFFMDADDLLPPGALAGAAEAADGCDILVFGLTMRHEAEDGAVTFTEDRLPEDAVCDTRRAIAELAARLDVAGVFPYMKKLYRAAFLRELGVRVPPVQSMEDFFFNIRVFPAAKRVVSLKKAYYIYRKPAKETLASAYNPDFFPLSKKRYTAMRDYLRDAGADSDAYRQMLYAVFFKHLIASLVRVQTAGCLSEPKKKEAVARYLADGLTVEILGAYKPTSVKTKVLVRVFRGRGRVLPRLAVKAVAFVQKKAGRLFSRLR